MLTPWLLTPELTLLPLVVALRLIFVATIVSSSSEVLVVVPSVGHSTSVVVPSVGITTSAGKHRATRVRIANSATAAAAAASLRHVAPPVVATAVPRSSSSEVATTHVEAATASVTAASVELVLATLIFIALLRASVLFLFWRKSLFAFFLILLQKFLGFLLLQFNIGYFIKALSHLGQRKVSFHFEDCVFW